jgi:3-oxoacyl-[acyl-carrier protein] reductase
MKAALNKERKLNGKVALVTGASQGIGAAIAERLATEGAIIAIKNAIFEVFGRIDILVNNAGSFAFAPLEAIDEAQVHSQLGVNLIGPIFATQAAAKHFPKEGGRVINVVSVASSRPLPG